jgi:hypothetical protein
MRRTSVLMLIAMLAGILVFSQQNRDDETTRKAYFKEHYKKTPNKEVFIEFQGEKYYLAWSKFEANGAHLEFLRDGENVKSYTKMISVVTASPEISYEVFLQAYLDGLRSVQVAEPVLLHHKANDSEKETVIDALLWDRADHVECILAKVYADKKGRVNVIVHSVVWKYSKIKGNLDILKPEVQGNRNAKLEELDKLDFETFP